MEKDEKNTKTTSKDFKRQNDHSNKIQKKDEKENRNHQQKNNVTIKPTGEYAAFIYLSFI